MRLHVGNSSRGERCSFELCLSSVGRQSGLVPRWGLHGTHTLDSVIQFGPRLWASQSPSSLITVDIVCARSLLAARLPILGRDDFAFLLHPEVVHALASRLSRVGCRRDGGRELADGGRYAAQAQ